MKMQEYKARARSVSTFGKIFFFADVLFSICSFALAMINIGEAGKEEIILIGSIAGVAMLLLGLFGVYLFHQVASLLLEFAKIEEEKADAAFHGEDGLPEEFCREILAYSAAQLRLIIDEQKEEYTEKEFAYIQNVLIRKTEKKK